MTDEQRKSVALEYLKAFDNGGVTPTGESILELFAPDAQVYFPKWGIANGREQIGQLFGEVAAACRRGGAGGCCGGSRARTCRSRGCLSYSTRNTPARTPSATRGWPSAP